MSLSQTGMPSVDQGDISQRLAAIGEQAKQVIVDANI